ncbi:hypothetical protein HHI36_011524 [Cryptolaemus montrouzieri]|uniref:Uncharacterized protein n=1 Tax=Cryptolaemus montrouzieri TaxID=559131 RepID=A0ABD2MMC2_9CUCU
MCNRCVNLNAMNTTGNETLERIQKEIKENLEKEEEWKRELERISKNKIIDPGNNNLPEDNLSRVNGVVKKQVTETSEKGNLTSQNVNKFIQNVKTKGIMHRFLKSKGKPTAKPLTNGSFQPHKVITDFTYQPPRATTETGILSRNGFIPADVKIRNEVQDFQQREIELRKERRKSQPELMALLNLEDDEIKDEVFTEYSCSSSTSSASEMKSAKSLADLCNTPEEELETPGTYNLIKHFESWKKL